MRTNRSPRILAALSLLAGTALVGLFAAGCKSNGGKDAAGSTQVSDEFTVSAAVIAVDPVTRLLTLEREDGTNVVVLAGSEVRNFDQIAPGDVVKVRYRESLAASIKQPGEAVEPDSGTLAVGTAEAGAMPAGAIGHQVTTTVRIETIDKDRGLVTFTPQGGGLRVVRIERAEGKKFIKKLKPGDLVEITYTEALAVSVEEQ